MSRPRLLLALTLLSVFGLFAASFSAEPAPTQERRDSLKKQFDAGNFKDAYEGYRALALNKEDDPLKVGDDLKMAIDSLDRLSRTDEADDFREKVIEVHKSNWRLLHAAADSLIDTPFHFGFRVAGKFYRGNKRGGGEFVSSQERDRTRALQLMQDAIPVLNRDNDGNAKGDFYLDFARMLLNYRGYGEAWRLQVLTNLAELPDYEPGYYYGAQTRGAPVDADGKPIFYTAPKRWEDATSDGQRWRFALAQAVEMSAAKANSARMALADFLQNQFDVQTMARFGYLPAETEEAKEGERKDDKANPYAVHTLGEDETIARLADGVKRFKLPDEFNFIKIYQTVADNPKTGHGAEALERLAQIFENRRQYPKAVDYWRRVIKEYGPGDQNYRQKRLEQIIGNWGRFEPIMNQPAGQGATVDFTFRNGEKVSFEAHAIKIEKLLDDVKAYLKSRPAQLDWQKVNIENLGYRLVEQNEQQYLGEKAAAWDLALKPRADHFDRRLTVETPLKKAGAYLLVAKMAGGNTSRIVIWLEDTAIVKKPLEGKTLYVVADAVSGKPLPKMNVEMFGYRNRWVAQNHIELDFQNFARFTDADGET
ncbi:MAG TPA: alpha-2-macroglobulin, partial [Pirellulales bacterium]|nr:alpha-2-macroglobulin [Pirellulales bacterium]